MSISSTVRKAGPFAGNDVQTVFAFAFKVFLTSDVLVTRAVAGVETVLTLGVDYNVALNVDQDAAPGGNVTLTAALATGATLAITSNVDSLQAVTVTNGGGFFPAVFNAIFDKLTILAQQLAEKLSRALIIPVTSSGVTSLTVPVLASGVLQWKSDGSGLQAITLPDLSLSLALPAQGGQAGKYLTTNGVVASWALAPITSVAGLTGAITAAGLKGALAFTVASITDYAADQATRATALNATAQGYANTAQANAAAQAIAFAVAL